MKNSVPPEVGDIIGEVSVDVKKKKFTEEKVHKRGKCAGGVIY